MDTLAANITRKAQTNPDAIFCTFIAAGSSQQISFGQVYDNGLRYARELMNRGVTKGSIVLIVLQHSPHLFYSFVGAILAGAVPSFMPFPSSKQRPETYWRDHEMLFARIEPKLIITYESNGEAARTTLPGLSAAMLYASDELLTEPFEEGFVAPGLSASEHDIACLQHSSGTTGLKKGVALTHAAIFRQIEAYSSSIGLRLSDVIASWLPLYHDMGFVACFLTSLVTGTQLVALDPFEWVMRPAMLLEAIERNRATFCWLPNFAFGHLVKTAKPGVAYDLSSMRAFINCSEPCKFTTMERFVQRFASSGVRLDQMQVCYAMAENVFAVTQTAIGREPAVRHIDPEFLALDRINDARAGSSRTIVSCGTPVEGVSVQIRADGRAAEPNAVGEVFIASAFQFAGYYGQPELTAKRLHDGWFATGDVGFLMDGELYVVGRVDDMIVVNGRNYYAHEIEDVVNSIDGALPGRNIALAIDDADADTTQVVVLVECPDGVDQSLLSATIRRRVSDLMGLTIYSIVALPPATLAKTTSGKISRVENKRMYIDNAFAYSAG